MLLNRRRGKSIAYLSQEEDGNGYEVCRATEKGKRVLEILEDGHEKGNHHVYNSPIKAFYFLFIVCSFWGIYRDFCLKFNLCNWYIFILLYIFWCTFYLLVYSNEEQSAYLSLVSCSEGILRKHSLTISRTQALSRHPLWCSWAYPI